MSVNDLIETRWKMKKILCLLLSVLIMGSLFSFKTEARNDNVEVVTYNGFLEQAAQNEEVSEAKHVDVCNGLPYHRMYANGLGEVFKGNDKYIHYGCVWKCEYCNAVLITRGDKYSFGSDQIGRYATYTLKPGEFLNENVNFFYSADSYGYTSAKTLPGYRCFFRR